MFKSPKFIPGLAITIAALTLTGSTIAIIKNNNNHSLPFSYASVIRQDLKTEITTDGKVKPAEALELGFESAGKITKVNVKVGQKVKAGTILASIQSADLAAATAQAQANVAVAVARAAQTQATFDGQIASTLTNADSAAKLLAEAKLSEEAAKNAAAANLDLKNSVLLSAAQIAAANTREALLVLTDIQAEHFMSFDQSGSQIADKKAAAIQGLFAATNAGRYDRSTIASLNGGVYESVTAMQENNPAANITMNAGALISAMRDSVSAFNVIPQNGTLRSTEVTQISNNIATLNQNIASLSSALAGYKNQESLNAVSLSAAATAVTTAQNNLATIQNQQVTNSPENAAQNANNKKAYADLAAAQAGVAQARAALAAASAQYAKATLKAPMAGTITAVNAKVGQFATTSAPAISLMSEGSLQIEAYIAQTQLNGLAIGAAAIVKIDGNTNQIFDATVISVDPAATINNGTESYRIVLQFSKEDDQLKAGMHASLNIKIADIPAALLIPESAVIRHDNQTYVFTKANADQEKAITIGTISNGLAEVLNGLSENDQVAVFGSTK